MTAALPLVPEVGATPDADLRAPHVVGVDLSLRATGVATPTDTYTITSTGTDDDGWTQRDLRLRAIRAQILHATDGAELVVIEGPSYSSQGRGSFDRAGLWWMVYRGLVHRDRNVAVVTPAQRALYATGKGNADKGLVVDAVTRRWPHWRCDGNDNRADAAVLCAMGLDALGHPLTVMPAAHRAALDKVTWPGTAV